MSKRLCTCTLCRSYTVVHPITGELIPGLYVTPYLYQQHAPYRESGPTPGPEATTSVEVADLDFETSILASTLDESDLMSIDPFVVARQSDLAEIIDEDDLSAVSDIDMDPVEADFDFGASEMAIDSEVLAQEVEQIRSQFADLEKEFLRRSKSYVFPTIQFQTPPQSVDEPIPELSLDLNLEVFAHQDVLALLVSRLEKLKPSDNDLARRITDLLIMIQEHEGDLDRHIRTAWEKEKLKALEDPYLIDTSARLHWSKTLAKFPPAVLGIYVTLATLYLLVGTSRSACNFLLMAFPIIFHAAFTSYLGETGTNSTSLPSPLPSYDPQTHDIREAIKALQIDPETLIYAACPQCCCIYPPRSGRNRYPKSAYYPAMIEAHQSVHIVSNPCPPGSAVSFLDLISSMNSDRGQMPGKAVR
ncbi:hypothetical protein BDN72DRAFT_906479 [Pluteus cervinus]|uniref:Uncharacterized protein n=1 Tax=Pluteus cervinus TaxID=181527 RepID=A0ACD2ZYR7_9AGAR|nr:hypothetical protein BDN72DRAFT_906479 [Pluteus cervinus]